MKLNWSPIQATAFRLNPGDDLKASLAHIAKENRLNAASIISAVGSLSIVALRLANCQDLTYLEGKHEIVSLSGTLSSNGLHLHMSVSNAEGQTVGGHLMDGCLVYTTAEIVVANLSALVFTREHCTVSGFNELIVQSNDEV